MHVRSLAYRTDLIFPAFDGEIIDRGDHLVIRTPSNPTFYWGNFLLFSGPPQEGDVRRWRDLFAKEIGAPPEFEHQSFGWDSPGGEQGVIEPFRKAGFRPELSVVMTTAELRPPARPSQRMNFRVLKAETDWEQAVDNQVIGWEAEYPEGDCRLFRQRSIDRYRKMAAAGLGNWFGAFIDDRLVADLGIFHDKGLGRYQSVETHPDFRRQGIAGTLIYEAGRQAIVQHHLSTLVMVAEEASSPARLYESLGFRPKEKQVGLLLPPLKGPHAGDPG